MPTVNLVVTTGEPAGIGPEISVAAAAAFLAEQPNASVTLLGDSNLLKSANPTLFSTERCNIQAIPLGVPVKPGRLEPKNAPYVLELLSQAIDGCQQGRFDAMVTAPIQKSIINEAGVAFTGHTEFLAERCKVKHVVMMLCASLPKDYLGFAAPKNMRVALTTTHIPLQAVPSALTVPLVLDTLQILHHDLQARFGIANPSIRVAGLNPHAGEGGYLGREEIDIIAPAIELAKNAGMNVAGPFPGDTMFDLSSLGKVDAYLAMYHDQGLAPFKFVTFAYGVNVTLGLPIIRTSVDHGTALDLAGKGLADSSSMLEALRLAYQLALNQKERH